MKRTPEVGQTSGGSFNNPWVSNFHCGLGIIMVKNEGELM